jgi:hypothetical protein
MMGYYAPPLRNATRPVAVISLSQRFFAGAARQGRGHAPIGVLQIVSDFEPGTDRDQR